MIYLIRYHQQPHYLQERFHEILQTRKHIELTGLTKLSTDTMLHAFVWRKIVHANITVH